MTNKDKTGNVRQQRRREKERNWLQEHGFTSWEQVHTLLMSGSKIITDSPEPKKAGTK